MMSRDSRLERESWKSESLPNPKNTPNQQGWSQSSVTAIANVGGQTSGRIDRKSCTPEHHMNETGLEKRGGFGLWCFYE
jgi:hypothetical protein